MVAINHALTGAFIGLIIEKPIIAVPVALASHFICDALPHFGSRGPSDVAIRTKFFRNYLISDALACVGLVAVLLILQPDAWLLAAVCALVATSPDFLWIPKYLAAIHNRTAPVNLYTKFATGIQWFQRPIGIFVEIAWFVGLISLIMPLVSQ